MNIPLNPVSVDLIKVRYLSRLPWCLAAAAALICWALFDGGTWGYYGAAIAMLVLVWQAWLIPKQVEKLGWLDTDEDLLLCKGKLWHTYTIVPYGRVQYVDVSQGPIERLYGLKTLRLNTASTTADTIVRGLDAQVADTLKDRVASKVKEKMIDL